jgi:hypothetical protein
MLCDAGATATALDRQPLRLNATALATHYVLAPVDFFGVSRETSPSPLDYDNFFTELI